MPERKKVVPTANRMPNSISDSGKRAADLRRRSMRASTLMSGASGSKARVVMSVSGKGAGRRTKLGGPKPGAAAAGGSALRGCQRAADDLLASALGHGEPGVVLAVLLRG